MSTVINNLKRWTVRHWIVAAIVAVGFVFFAVAPLLDITTGDILPGKLSSPGSLAVLTIIFIIAALAVSYDIVMGYTGLFSFGHGLFFAIGGYAYAMMMAHTDADFGTSVVVGLLVTVVAAFLVNATALRATAIAFAMVTLAVGQVAYTLVMRNLAGTGGDEGLSVPYEKVPDVFIGIINTKNIYWLAFAAFIVVFVIAKWVTSTKLGHTWQAIRENDLRVSVMGLNVYAYKLSATMIASLLAGGLGIVYVIALGRADPGATNLFFSLALVVMLTIGGAGRIWGAALGGALYTLMEQRLPTLAASDAVAGLPDWLKLPLSEPQVLLGIIFIVFIFTVRDGLAGLLLKAFGFAKSDRGESTRGRGRRSAGKATATVAAPADSSGEK